MSESVKEIYVYGLSFDDVDMFFINIIDTTDVIFYLNSFNKDNFDEYKTKIIDAGFKVKFSVYNS